MNIKKILDEVYPITAKQRNCRFEMQKLQYKRDKLTEMIEAYKRGDVVNFEPLKISIDLSAILEKYN
jgi:hypothetical protein